MPDTTVLYVSYSGKVDKEVPGVNTLVSLCRPPRFALELDKAALSWGDDIRDFMDRLAGAPHADQSSLIRQPR